MAVSTSSPSTASTSGAKGLERNALGLVSSVIVGVAATTPAVGVALVLGLMVTDVGVQLPAIVLLGFLPIVMIAGAYCQLNRVDPDCGTLFSWATRAFGPYVGWFGGFLIVSSLAVIVTNYTQLLGTYGFLLVGWDAAAASTLAVTIAGVVWFLAITFVAYRGIELSARVHLVRPDAAVRRRARRRVRVLRAAVLGLGHDDDGQRGDRGQHPDPRARRGAEHRDPAGDLRHQRDRRARVRGSRTDRGCAGGCALPPRHRGARVDARRAARGHRPHRRHRRRDLPPDRRRPHPALDGGPRRASAEPREDPSALPHPHDRDAAVQRPGSRTSW